MALDQVVRNAAAGLSANSQLQQQIGAAVASYVLPEVLAVVSNMERMLDPAVNTTLGDAIHGVVLGAARYGLDPQQWYNQSVEIYKQPMFGYGLGNGNLIYAIYLLSSLYVSLKKSRDRNAQIYSEIVKSLLVETLYNHYQSIGQNPPKQFIRAYIDRFANAFNGGHTGALNNVYSNTLLGIWDPLFAESTSTLISTLDGVVISTIQNLMYTIYSKVQIPQVVALILNDIGKNGLYNDMFNYIFNRKINDYIGQVLQQLPQQAGQHQGGQQSNQPNVQQPPQPSASQQPAPQQQQAPQGGQSANQFRQPPGPNVLRP
jgi:hypothetical protein